MYGACGIYCVQAALMYSGSCLYLGWVPGSSYGVIAIGPTRVKSMYKTVHAGHTKRPWSLRERRNGKCTRSSGAHDLELPTRYRASTCQHTLCPQVSVRICVSKSPTCCGQHVWPCMLTLLHCDHVLRCISNRRIESALRFHFMRCRHYTELNLFGSSEYHNSQTFGRGLICVHKSDCLCDVRSAEVRVEISLPPELVAPWLWSLLATVCFCFLVARDTENRTVYRRVA